jgi:acetyltransferase-like isoleucine patch superfamily enzyme
MRQVIKNLVSFFAYIIVLPSGFFVNLEKKVSRHAESWFTFFAQFWALMPGLPGCYLRAAYYRQVLDYCDKECYIGFGTICTHRQVRIEKNVYIGPYSMIGSCWIKESSLIGTRVSVLSGKAQHEMGEDGNWTSFSPYKMKQICIGPRAWLGEGVILMADVGKACLIGSGAVVSNNVPDKIVGAGNPFRAIRKVMDV